MGTKNFLRASEIPLFPLQARGSLCGRSFPKGRKDRRSYSRRDTPLLIHQQPPRGTRAQSSHAEAFYLQKQMQSQTQMIFMLEGGDRVEGAIEWYDADTIKVRNGNIRTLIYKTSIKYLYKAGDQHP